MRDVEISSLGFKKQNKTKDGPNEEVLGLIFVLPEHYPSTKDHTPSVKKQSQKSM